jgi:S-DNA-T family DNA segregation ATPase FtsK/SpoIIIE
VRYVLQYQRGSVSLLQRKLNIGYGRASRLIDFMAEDHVVGEYSGSQAREVLMTLDEWEARRGQGVGGYKDSVGDEEEPEIQDDELVENEK